LFEDFGAFKYLGVKLADIYIPSATSILGYRIMGGRFNL
jgi:hypothetical protein